MMATLRFTITRGEPDGVKQPNWGRVDGYREPIVPNGWTYSFTSLNADGLPRFTMAGAYWTGPGIPTDPPPTARDVMESLLLDASMPDEYSDLADFLANLYVTDSPDAASIRRGMAAWEACQETARNLTMLLGDELRAYEQTGDEWLDERLPVLLGEVAVPVAGE